MNWIEANPIPKECRRCKKDCYNCDIAGKRWVLSQEDELRIRCDMMERAAQRMQRKLKEQEQMQKDKGINK